MNYFFDQDPFMQNLINYHPLPVFDQSFNQEGTVQEPTNPLQYGYTYAEQSQEDEYYYHQPKFQEPKSYRDQLIGEIPKYFQPYVIGIQDVEGDGNCGFRSVAVAMGRNEDEWPAIRRELLEELNENKKQYKSIFDSEYKRLEESLNFFEYRAAPFCNWMWMPNTGLLISNKYNCILHYLTNERCVTYFPLWSKPRSPKENHAITLAFVHSNHFVKVDLQEGHPIPDVSGFNLSKKSQKKDSEWVEIYKDRLLFYKELNCNIDLNVVPVE